MTGFQSTGILLAEKKSANHVKMGNADTKNWDVKGNKKQKPKAAKMGVLSKNDAGKMT